MMKVRAIGAVRGFQLGKMAHKVPFVLIMYVAVLFSVFYCVGCYKAEESLADTETSADDGTDSVEINDSESDSADDVATDKDETDSDTGFPIEESIECVAPEREKGISDKDDEVIDPEPHTVLVIFDKSGSMSSGWVKDGSKWDVASDTLQKVVGMAAAYTTLGAILFPLPDGCSVPPIGEGGQIPFQIGKEFLSSWSEVVEQYGPDGSTPMEMAFRRADQAIVDGCKEGIMERPLTVMLYTDGEPNCAGDNEALVYFAKKWLKNGVRTFVFGLPGSESARDILNDIAKAGGTGTFIQPVDPDELEDETSEVIL